MALIHTSKAEFSDLFYNFFEDCPYQVENALAIPHDPPEGTRLATELLPAEQFGGTRLLNLDPQTYSNLANAVADDFLSHTRRPSDFSIDSVHILRNPDIWDRYQATKKIRRERMRKTQESRRRARAEAALPTSPAASDGSLAESEDQDKEEPEVRFRDEILFHGTQQSKISSILHNGLDPKMTVRANYGKGVYFSDSIEKCMQYTDVQTSMGQQYSIILCCVLLGKILVEPYDKSSRRLYARSNFLPPGYDSAVAHDVFKEWVVMEKSQVLPLCVINFKTSNNPDCFYRLSQHEVLFRGTGLYPSSVNEVQRVCTVPVPMDANASLSTDNTKPEDWHRPDVEFALMLELIYNVDVSVTKVRMLKFPRRVEWLIEVKKAAPAPTIRFYMDDTNRTSLMSSSKNIKTLQDRLKSDRALATDTRNRQKTNIDALISVIPNFNGLLATMQDNGAEVERIRAQGHQVEQDLKSLQQQAIQRGMDPYYSHDFQVTAHPLRVQLAQLEKEFREKLEDRASWTAEHWTQAQNIVNLQKSYEEQCRMDAEREQRNVDSIKAESARVASTSQGSVVALSQKEMETRILNAAKECSQVAPVNPTEKFGFKDQELQTVSLQCWPQVVAELLMPTLMTTLLPGPTVLQLNNTTLSQVEKRIQKLGLSLVQELWEIAPTMAFSMPVASPIFWPITAQRRLANRRMFQLKHYLEWIFLESESRSRKIQSRELLPGQKRFKNSKAAEEIERDPLKDLDVAALLKERWEELDPSIEPALRGLLSRTGTVTFNRKAREAEVAAMGSNLMENLYVTADAKMLAKEESCSSSSTAPSKAECPICQDEMQVQDTQPMVSPSPNDPAPERVVKLNGCRHIFHEGCINTWFQAEASQLKCPLCSAMCTTKGRAGATKGAFSGKPIKLGPMPDATLGYAFDVRLACYFIYVCVPGHYMPVENDPTRTRVWIKPEYRHIVVPFTARLGPLLMIRLICLFYYGHLFMVGRSLTRNVDNVVIWNGVHVRTDMRGAYGFPAPEFERNCWEELDRKGVAMGLEKLLVDMVPAPVPLDELIREQLERLNYQRFAGSSSSSSSSSPAAAAAAAAAATAGLPSLAADEQDEDLQRLNVNRLFRPEQHYAFRI